MHTKHAHTDSVITDYHEDGTWTTTTVITEREPTRAEKAQAWTALGGLTVVAFAPLLCVVIAEKYEARKERKAVKKAEKLAD